MNTLLHKVVLLATFPSIAILSLTLATPHSHAQTTASSSDQSLHGGAAAGDSSSRSTAAADAGIPPAVAKELAAMKERIEQLEAELKTRKAQEQAPQAASLVTTQWTTQKPQDTAQTPQQPSAAGKGEQAVPPEKAAPSEPFAYADWTWLNGNPRNKDVIWDSKFLPLRSDSTLTLCTVSTIPETTRLAARQKSFGPMKSSWSKSASAEISTGKTFAAES